jgi:hypothetical protein
MKYSDPFIKVRRSSDCDIINRRTSEHERPIDKKILFAIISIPFIPLIIAQIPFLTIKYIDESYSTVECIIKQKIQKYNLIYEDYLSDLQILTYFFTINHFFIKIEYFNAIREAYVNLLGRKTPDELESLYHHKSSLKDDVLINDKKVAKYNLKKSLLTVENKKLLMREIERKRLNF